MVCKSTTPPGQPYEAIAPAAVVQTLLTCSACPIVYDGLDDDAIALLVVFYVVGYFFDNAAELVSER